MKISQSIKLTTAAYKKKKYEKRYRRKYCNIKKKIEKKNNFLYNNVYDVHFRNGNNYEKHYSLDSLHEIQWDSNFFDQGLPSELSNIFIKLHICD